MHDLIQHADAFVGDPDQESGGLSRRSFLGKSATLGAVGLVAGWTPAFVIQPAEAAASSCPALAGFPAGLELIGGRPQLVGGNRRRRPLELRPAH